MKKIGLVGILGIWLTAGISFSLVNILKDFTPAQLLIARGLMAILCALILTRGHVFGGIDKYAVFMAVCSGITAFCLFTSFRCWSISGTIIVYTLAPIVNFSFTLAKGEKIKKEALICFLMIFAGVVIATFKGDINAPGLIWSSIGTIFVGLIYECFKRSKTSVIKLVFWTPLGVTLLAIATSRGSDWAQLLVLSKFLSLVAFGFIGGFMYWMSNAVAMRFIETQVASVLAQGETPVVILFSVLLVGEQISSWQWIGVTISICGALLLAYYQAKR